LLFSLSKKKNEIFFFGEGRKTFQEKLSIKNFPRKTESFSSQFFLESFLMERSKAVEKRKLRF
jgi:hypothetical protein